MEKKIACSNSIDNHVNEISEDILKYCKGTKIKYESLVIKLSEKSWQELAIRTIKKCQKFFTTPILPVLKFKKVSFFQLILIVNILESIANTVIFIASEKNTSESQEVKFIHHLNFIEEAFKNEKRNIYTPLKNDFNTGVVSIAGPYVSLLVTITGLTNLIHLFKLFMGTRMDQFKNKITNLILTINVILLASIMIMMQEKGLNAVSFYPQLSDQFDTAIEEIDKEKKRIDRLGINLEDIFYSKKLSLKSFCNTNQLMIINSIYGVSFSVCMQLKIEDKIKRLIAKKLIPLKKQLRETKEEIEKNIESHAIKLVKNIERFKIEEEKKEKFKISLKMMGIKEVIHFIKEIRSDRTNLSLKDRLSKLLKKIENENILKEDSEQKIEQKWKNVIVSLSSCITFELPIFPAIQTEDTFNMNGDRCTAIGIHEISSIPATYTRLSLPILMDDESITEGDQINLELLMRTLLREKPGKINNRVVTSMHQDIEKNHYEIQFSKDLFEPMVLTKIIIKILETL